MTTPPFGAQALVASVTALLPAWQAADFIQATLDSLSAQTYTNFRVIVSVDVCEDGTREICEAHAAKDPRFHVVQQASRLESRSLFASYLPTHKSHPCGHDLAH